MIVAPLGDQIDFPRQSRLNVYYARRCVRLASGIFNIEVELIPNSRKCVRAAFEDQPVVDVSRMMDANRKISTNVSRRKEAAA